MPPELEYFFTDTVRNETDAVNYIVIAPFDTKATALKTQDQDDSDNASIPLIRLQCELVRKIGAKCGVAYRSQSKLSIIQRLYNLKAATMNLPLIPVENEDGEQRTPVRRNRASRGETRGTDTVDGDAGRHAPLEAGAVVPPVLPAAPAGAALPTAMDPPNASPERQRIDYDDAMAEFAAPLKRGRYDSEETARCLDANAQETRQLCETLTYSSRVTLISQQIQTLATELSHLYGTEARLIRQMARMKRHDKQIECSHDSVEDKLTKLQAELDAKRSAVDNDAEESNVDTMELQMMQQIDQLRHHVSTESTVTESLAKLHTQLTVNCATIQALRAQLATEEDALLRLLRSREQRVAG